MLCMWALEVYGDSSATDYVIPDDEYQDDVVFFIDKI